MQGQDWIAHDSRGNEETDGDWQAGRYVIAEIQDTTEARVKLEGKSHSSKEGGACGRAWTTEA